MSQNENVGKPAEKKQEWRPSIESYSRVSADGRFYIHRTVITDIKPVRYVETVLRNKAPGALPEKAQAKPRKTQEASG